MLVPYIAPTAPPHNRLSPTPWGDRSIKQAKTPDLVAGQTTLQTLITLSQSEGTPSQQMSLLVHSKPWWISTISDAKCLLSVWLLLIHVCVPVLIGQIKIKLRAYVNHMLTSSQKLSFFSTTFWNSLYNLLKTEPGLHSQSVKLSQTCKSVSISLDTWRNVGSLSFKWLLHAAHVGCVQQKQSQIVIKLVCCVLLRVHVLWIVDALIFSALVSVTVKS